MIEAVVFSQTFQVDNLPFQNVNGFTIIKTEKISTDCIFLGNKRPRGLNADAFFFKFAIIIIGLCVTIEARKRN